MGLVICKRLVELMKGEIGIESNIGVGTTVWFTAEFEFLNIQKSASNLLKEKQMFSLKGVTVVVITQYTKIANSLYTILNYYGILMTSLTIDEFSEFITRHHSPIFRIIIDFPYIESFFNKFDITKINTLINCKFICLVPLKQRVKQLINIDYIITTPFKYKTLLNCFDTTRQSNDNQNNNQNLIDNNNNNNINSFVNNNNNSNIQLENTKLKFGNRILIAEDNLVNQKLILRQLKKVGYDADAASNGFQAVEKARHNQYDLILMDCHMPEMDGYEATKIIREQEGNRRVPIVALTADAMQGTRDRCLAAGMDDYYTKPLRHQDIVDITSKFLDQK